MKGIHHRFAEAIRSRLNGQATQLPVHDGRLWPALARQAELDKAAIVGATADALCIPSCDLKSRPVSPEFLATVPISFARRHGIVGLSDGNGGLELAISDVAQWPQIGVLARLLGKPVRPVFAPRDEIIRTINIAYQHQTSQVRQVLDELDANQVLDEVEKVGGNEDLLDVASRAPVIKLVNLILFEAVKRRASDVHVQPYEDRLIVRFRVDGVLYDMFTPPVALQQEIVSRVKVMAGMNIAERRLAQDGRATVEVGDRVVDLRIATLPTSFGERVVIRLLDKSVRLYRLSDLGMPDATLTAFRRLIAMDHGIILVTGPTGSGKTTTLYAALQELNSKEMNIITLEDPIEYRLDGVSQTQVSEKKGMTFASGLRHVLRQDPDIIMVGEIRDAETAHMAIQSALTGHLVFSTLHTNDAAGAVSRLLDLGVEPYLLASCLLGALAQRLVRRICPHCLQQYSPDAAEMERLQISPNELAAGQLFRGAGCDECMGTGFRERVGLFELLTVSDGLREMVHHRAKSSSIKQLAISEGMTTLRADALAKAAGGNTTLAEVARVTGRSEF